MSEDEYIRIMNEGRELTIKELVSEFVDKIESMRVKFRDNLGYTAVSLMNDLWDYLRELEERLK